MSTPTPNLMSLAESLVAYGRKQGASEIEVTIQEGSEFNVNIREQNLESLTEAGSKGLQLRVFVDGKAANASSSDLTQATLTRLVDNAIARARMAGKDALAGLPDKQEMTANAAALKLFDPAIATMPPEKKIEIAKKLEAIGMADKRVKKSTGSSFGNFAGRTFLVNSKGFSGSFERSVVYCGCGFQVGEGDNLFQDGWFDGTTSLAELMQPEVIAKKAVERVTRLIGAKKVETQKVPVIAESPVTEQFLGFLAGCVDGASIDRKQSLFVDKLGQRIGNDLVNIVDDGLLIGGRGTRPFDSEGVPCRKTVVFDKGVLKSYLLDTYYGRKLKLASTGNAAGPTNLYWVAGKHSLDEMIKSVDKGLLLTGTLGLGTEATTGDISLGAFGLWIEKGKIAYPVAEITISANLADMLKNVAMVGNDLEMRNSICAPSVKFAEMTVGGITAKS